MCRFISDLKQTLLKSSSVDNEKVNKVFGNIESLYLISSNIYAKCDEEVRKHDNDYDKSNLGKVIGNLAAYLKLYTWTVPLATCRYTEYINCYKESLDIVADSSEKKDAFYNECEKAKKNMNVTMDLGVSPPPSMDSSSLELLDHARSAYSSIPFALTAIVKVHSRNQL